MGRAFLAIITAALTVGIWAPPTMASTCVPGVTDADRVRWSDVIFEGTALDGVNQSGIQRFQVMRYLKGSGPEVVRVHTGSGWIMVGDAQLIVTGGIYPAEGSQWRIFAANTSEGLLRTSHCMGSARLPLPPLQTTVAPVASPSPSEDSTKAEEPPPADEMARRQLAPQLEASPTSGVSMGRGSTSYRLL